MPHLIKRVVDVEYGSQTLRTCIIADEETHAIMPAASAYLFSMTKDHGARLNSVKSYAATLVSFLNTVGEDPKIESFADITDKQMRAYLELILIDHKKVKVTTVDQYISRLNQFYEYCYKAGFIEDKPHFSFQLSDAKKRESKLGGGRINSLDPFRLGEQYIPIQEFTELLAYKPRVGDYENERDDIVFKLGYFSGLRASETVSEDNFKISRIKQSISEADKKGDDGFLLWIIGKGSNGGKSRQIYVPSHLRQQILRFINTSRSNILGDLLICKSNGAQLHERHASDTFSDAIDSLIKANGSFSDAWKNNRIRSYHSLRHSYATNLAQWLKERGLPRHLLNERLGHEDDLTTLIYIHFNAIITNDIDTQNEIAPVIKKKMKTESLANE